MSGTGCILTAGEREALPAVMRGRGAGAPRCGARTRRWRPVTETASARSAGSSIPVPARCAAGRAGSAGRGSPRWIRRRVRSVGESRRGPGRRRPWPRRRPARRAAPAGCGTSSRRASARSTPAAAPWGRRTGRDPVTSGRNRFRGRPTGRRGRPSCGSAGGRCGTRRPTGRPSSPTRRTPNGRAVRRTAGSSAGTGPRSGL